MSAATIPCPGCGADNPARNRFCIECGDAVEAPCPACGAVNAARARFCGECGGPLGAEATAVGTTHRPEEYTPRHLAEPIVGSRTAMEGERKQVTVIPTIREILAQMRAMEFGCPEPLALRVLADALVARDGVESAEAEETLTTCISVCQKQEAAPQLAHTHASLAKLLASRGLAREAREELSQALGLYRSMEMQHWIPSTEAALQSVSQEVMDVTPRSDP